MNLELDCGLVSSHDPHASAADSLGTGRLSYPLSHLLSPKKGIFKIIKKKKTTDKIMNLLTKNKLGVNTKGVGGGGRTGEVGCTL